MAQDLSVHIPERSLPPLVLASYRGGEEIASTGPSTAEIYGSSSARPHGNRPQPNRRKVDRLPREHARDREQHLHNEALPSRVERAWGSVPKRFGEGSGGSGVNTPMSTQRTSPTLQAGRSGSPGAVRPLPPTGNKPSVFRGRMGNIVSHILEFGVSEEQFVEYLDTVKEDQKQKWLHKLGRLIAKIGSLFDATRFLGQGITKPLQHVNDILNVTKSIVDAELIIVYKVSDARDELSLFCSTNISGKEKDKATEPDSGLPRRIPIGQGFAGTVAEQGKTLNLSNAYRDSRFSLHVEGTSNIYDVKSILCVPIRSSAAGVVPGQIVGVVEAVNSLAGRFSKIEEVLLERTAIAIGSLRIFKSGLVPATPFVTNAVAASLEQPPLLDAHGSSHASAYSYVHPNLEEQSPRQRAGSGIGPSVLPVAAHLGTTSGSNNSVDSPANSGGTLSARGKERPRDVKEKDPDAQYPHSAVPVLSSSEHTQQPKPPARHASGSIYARPHPHGKDKLVSSGSISLDAKENLKDRKSSGRSRKRIAGVLDGSGQPASITSMGGYMSPTEGASPRFDADRAHLIVNKFERDMAKLREEGKRLQAISSGKLPISSTEEQLLAQLSTLKAELESLRRENSYLRGKAEEAKSEKKYENKSLGNSSEAIDAPRDIQYFQVEESDMGSRLSLTAHVSSSSLDGARPYSADLGKALFLGEDAISGRGCGITGAIAFGYVDQLRGEDGVALVSSKGVIVSDTTSCSFYDEAYDGETTRSLCASVVYSSKTGGRPVGVVRMTSRVQNAFVAKDLRTVEAVALLIGSAGTVQPHASRRADASRRPHRQPHPPSPTGDNKEGTSGGSGSRRPSISHVNNAAALEKRLHALHSLSTTVLDTGSNRDSRTRILLSRLVTLFGCAGASVFIRREGSTKGTAPFEHRLTMQRQSDGEFKDVHPSEEFKSAVIGIAAPCEASLIDGEAALSSLVKAGPRPPASRPPSAQLSRPQSREAFVFRKGVAIGTTNASLLGGNTPNECSTGSHSVIAGLIPGSSSTVYGCITLHRSSSDEASFTEVDCLLLADACLALAPMLSSAQVQWNASEDLSLSRRLQEAMPAVTRIMERASGDVSEKTLLKTIEREVMMLARGSRCSLFFYDDAADALISPSIPTENDNFWRGDLGDSPLILSAVKSQSIQVLTPEEVASLRDAGEAGDADAEEVFCVLTAPLLSDVLSARADGALQVERTSHEVGSFSEADKTVLTTFCGAIAPILERLRTWALSKSSAK